LLDYIKIHVKLLHVLYRSIFGDMAAEFYEIDVDLQRRIAEQAQEVGFRGFLDGHKIQDGNLQRSDVLCIGSRIVNNENVFLLQQLYRWKFVRDCQRHFCNQLYIFGAKLTKIIVWLHFFSYNFFISITAISFNTELNE